MDTNHFSSEGRRATSDSNASIDLDSTGRSGHCGGAVPTMPATRRPSIHDSCARLLVRVLSEKGSKTPRKLVEDLISRSRDQVPGSRSPAEDAGPLLPRVTVRREVAHSVPGAGSPAVRIGWRPWLRDEVGPVRPAREGNRAQAGPPRPGFGAVSAQRPRTSIAGSGVRSPWLFEEQVTPEFIRATLGVPITSFCPP
jgi:hypothetical protein